MDTWRTGIVQADAEHIRIRGYDIGALMRHGSFADVIFLLHRNRLPSEGESKLLNAILIGCADHGSGAPSCATARLVASGNRQSLSAAIAGGLLAVGDEHGGAGSRAMELIGAARQRMQSEGVGVRAAAEAIVEQMRREGKHLPGLGHRVHTKDPRVSVLFGLAREHGIAGVGVDFMSALEEAAREHIRPLPLNIDGALAAVLFDMDFPPEAGKLLFLVARAAGLTAEVSEEYAREKPMRIRIPVTYDGEPPRDLR